MLRPFAIDRTAVCDAKRARFSWPDLVPAHLDLQPAIAAGRAASAVSLLVQLVARQRRLGRTRSTMGFMPSFGAARDFFVPNVNWITYARAEIGHCVVHRMA